MSAAPERPLFVWDGDCGFCRFWTLRWKARVGEAVEVAPYQRVGDRVPGMEKADFRRSAKLVEEDGTVREAAAAVFRLLSLGSGPGVGWWLYRGLPPFRWLAEGAYRVAARRRSLFGRLTVLLWGREPPPHGFRAAGWLVLRALALAYLLAFASLGVQVAGLVGPDGILPAGAYLDGVARSAASGLEAGWRAPTLAWLSAGDGALRLMCGVGAAAATALLLGVRPLLSAAVAWSLHLSLVVAGQAFTAYQWDLLLLEAGFLALLLAPAGRAPSEAGSASTEAAPGSSTGAASASFARSLRRRFFRAPEPWLPALWLVWWLLFRLILESGLVKLAGGDPVWRDLTAMAHHYENQPLPNRVAWFAHQLPMGIQKLSTLGTFGVELLAPLLFFLPRRPRFVAGVAVVAHQLLILASGNYTFFNLLTIGLALSLFDDGFWRVTLGGLPGGCRFLDALGVENPDLRARLRSIGVGSEPEEGGSDGEESTPGAGVGEGDGGGRRTGPGPAARRARVPAGLRRILAGAFGAVAVAVGGFQLARSGGLRAAPAPVSAVRRALTPFGVVNGYGLFADMTTRRPEIVLEGRRGDGPWRPIRFRYKPGDLADPPSQVAPHQPRLDWQMWFAALRADRVPPRAPSRVRYDRWLLRLVARLLDGEPRVWGLMAPRGAFRDGDELRPPELIRARLFDYRFTTPEERARSGRWWSRTLRGTYLPPVRRTDGGLEAVGGAAGQGRAGPAP